MFAHVGNGSHQHPEGDPDDTNFWDVADSWLSLIPGYEQVKDTVAWLQHVTYDDDVPDYTVTDIGGGFYRCGCGVSYSYYDPHGH